MKKTTFARRAIRLAGLLSLVMVLASCQSATAPRFPQEEEDKKEDPKEGVIRR